MSFFIGVLDELEQKIDQCVGLPSSSIFRIKSIMQKLDNEHKRRIKKGIKEQIKEMRQNVSEMEI